MQKPLKVYWSSGLKHGKKNFGDWLSPVLCEAISGRKVEYAKPNQCDLVAVGSILHRLKNHFWSHRVHVWGSGLIQEQAAFSSPHNFDAVRGKHTAALIKNQPINALGDPGLLSDMLLVEKNHPKRYRVGIVPHYVDQKHPAVIEFLKQSGVSFIDIFSETMDFLEQVARCEFILSSSLHGLIIADALNIPNAWIKLSERVRGNDFKFADYYSVFGLETMQPCPFDEQTSVDDLANLRDQYQRPGIDSIKKQLYEAFPFHV
ncbi:polysaccharide pyruvyl transferase family protein [uncultured Desulfuromonas sp.]|uniref:polysaccharide pyruvyl transferase family protein n=1 Tax=uncultured Desulfuromonas sp. TaxID=181013 RepID=UPI002AABCD07|nr:polysaccharide pyruvyl transferase family protein [uncultured Desulfuromonas sp.]